MGKFIIIWAMLCFIARFCYAGGITHVGSGCLGTHQNPTVNTVYRSNLGSLLNSLATNAPLQDGYFNTSVGNGSERVYGLAWCRAGVFPNTCSKCLKDSISIPLQDCPNIKDLVVWTSLCSLRFSNETFFGELWNNSSSSSHGVNGLDEPGVFTKGFSMMESLGRNVSNRPLMFESAVVDVGIKGKRYGLGQCSRDLSKLDCEKCLEDLLTRFQKYVLNRTRWEMLGVSCGMWYDVFRFYRPEHFRRLRIRKMVLRTKET